MANYSDYDLRMATQIAYIDGLDASVKAHPEWTLQQHFDNNPNLVRIFMEKNDHDPTLYNDLMSGKYADWKIVDIENTNSKTGFVACTIDTGDGDAIVGFRGSESMDMTQKINDWLIADGGLLNSTETVQQRQAREYLERVVAEHPDYDSFSVTGHSLGGNLAEHATVTASDKVYSKINRTLNLDGPGFSDEYIKAHSEAISKHTGKIDHYQYSLVGAILNPLPGSAYAYMLASEKDGLAFKHGTWNIKYDENGNMVPAEPDELAIAIHAFTNAVDDNTKLPGVLGVFDMLFWARNPLWIAKFEHDFLKYYQEYVQDIRKQMDARKANIDFKVNKNVLASADSAFSNCRSRLNTYADEVNRIKSSVNILIKLAAIYTVGIKLRTSSSNLEKMCRYSGNLSDAAENTLEAYQRYENAIASNAGK